MWYAPAMTIEITAADVTAAEELLATVVSEQVDSGRYTEGTALRDLVIKGLAVVSAQFRKEAAEVQASQSLLRLRALARTTAGASDAAVADATDAVLSNWFLTRNTGDFSRGIVQIVVSRKQDYAIPRDSRFFYDKNLAFFPDYDTDIVISASEVTPIVDGRGNIAAYSFTLNLIAGKTGRGYDVFPATWAGTGNFSSFVLRVSNSEQFQGGLNQESTDRLIQRSDTAIAVRNLINPRSISATLQERFKSVARLISLGMGDPEMQRDEKFEAATGVRLHMGGYFDIYLELPVATTTFEGILGGSYARPDGIINVFGDAGIADWTAEPVQPGDVIRITAGLPSVPRDYVIREITASALYTNETYPFPEAVDVASYFIYRPLFGPDVPIVPAVGVNTTGYTTNTVSTSGRLVLPAGPHYDIIDVAVVNPDPGEVYINNPDGLVHFTVRVNTTPVLPPSVDIALPFQVIGREPANGQSAFDFDEVVLPTIFDGKRVRVTYQTLAGFTAIDSFTRDRFQRVLAANVQAKGYHPVYLSMTIPFARNSSATSAVNQLALRQQVVSYIQSFSPLEVIDTSDIVQFVKNANANIGTVYPFEISYDLLAPDGRVITFRTDDVVALDPAKLDTTVNTGITLEDLLDMTVSNRTVRYMTRLDRIFVEER